MRAINFCVWAYILRTIWVATSKWHVEHLSGGLQKYSAWFCFVNHYISLYIPLNIFFDLSLSHLSRHHNCIRIHTICYVRIHVRKPRINVSFDDACPMSMLFSHLNCLFSTHIRWPFCNYFEVIEIEKDIDFMCGLVVAFNVAILVLRHQTWEMLFVSWNSHNKNKCKMKDTEENKYYSMSNNTEKVIGLCTRHAVAFSIHVTNMKIHIILLFY